jgi:hypothetical protein
MQTFAMVFWRGMDSGFLESVLSRIRQLAKNGLTPFNLDPYISFKVRKSSSF